MIKSNLPSLVPSSERLKQTIQLISKGYALKPELAVGQLTVYPWDEEISDWMITSSRAQDPLFTVAVVQKLTRLPSPLMERFVASELLLVMLVARSLSTKGEINYKARCPHCQTVQASTTLKVPGEMGILGSKAEDYPGFDEITLPESKDKIRFRPLQVMHLRQAIEARAQMVASISENGANLALSIQAVNDTLPESPQELFAYYLALPPVDVAYLKQKSKELSPALDTHVPHTCDAEDCRSPFHYNLGLHYDFFL